MRGKKRGKGREMKKERKAGEEMMRGRKEK